MKKYIEFVNEANNKNFLQKRQILEEYKKGDVVVFKSEFINEKNEKQIDLRVGEILNYNIDFPIYTYNIEDIVDYGQWLIPKSRVRRLASEKDIEKYKLESLAKKFNI